MASVVEEALKGLQAEVTRLDLRTLNLPACDGETAFAHPSTQQLQQSIQAADGIAIATPIYNYSVASVTKNCLELSSDWRGKAVSVFCAGATRNSFMALMPIFNSLILDYRAFLLPGFVHASTPAFEGGRIIDEAIVKRLQKLAQDFYAFTAAVKPLASLYKDKNA